MATPLATAFVRIRPDTSQFGRELQSDVNKAAPKAQAAAKKHGRLFGATFARSSAGPLRAVGGIFTHSLAGIGGAFAAVGAVKVFSGFISDARESNKVAALTAAAIKSTGGAAKISANQVGALATAISNKTGKDDEAIQSGENLLLTFTNIRNETGKGNDIFNQASSAIVDMTAALNNGAVTSSGLKASSIQLGKALNDPIKGVTALRKVGVSFTEQQTKQIKKLVESGHSLEAQKIILRELGKEFGGAAKASSNPMERLRVIVGNLGEQIGNKLIPYLDTAAKFIGEKIVPAIMRFIDGMKSGEGAGGQFVVIVGRIRDSVVTVAGAIAKYLIPILGTVAGIIQRDVLPVIISLVKWINKNREIIPAVGIAIATLLVPAFIAWAVTAGAAAVATIAAALPVIALGAAITALAFLVIKNWSTIKRWTLTTWKAVLGAFQAVWNWLKRNWPLLLGILTGPIGLATVLIIKNWKKIKDGLTSLVTAIRTFFQQLPGKITHWIGSVGTLLYNRGKSVVTGFWNGIKAVWSNVIDWFKGLPTKILHALGMSPPPKWATEGGRKIMQALLKGIIPGGKDILAYGKSIVSGLSATMGGAQLRFGGGGGAISGSSVQIGQQMAALVGWTGAQWRALYDLWNNESGWNPLADNPTSTAFGIPQFINSTAQQYGVLGSTDPSRQIAAGLQYISDRYGDPIHAWAHWTRNHSYAMGTPFVPATGLYGLHRGEAVIPAKHNRGGIGNTYNINIAVPPNANQHEIGRLTVSAIKAYERGSGSGWRK